MPVGMGFIGIISIFVPNNYIKQEVSFNLFFPPLSDKKTVV